MLGLDRLSGTCGLSGPIALRKAAYDNSRFVYSIDAPRKQEYESTPSWPRPLLVSCEEGSNVAGALALAKHEPPLKEAQSKRTVLTDSEAWEQRLRQRAAHQETDE